MAHPHDTAPIVTNDVSMDDDGRIGILTGPNQGGKTTYTQMVGLCQLLGQTGLWVPAAQARLSPVDNIYTHYPVEEHLARGTGRFGDEAQRLSQIFAHGTRHSLVLLNESLASTNPGESLYIAQDIVRILRRLGARAIFATHLHELAADVAALNASTAGRVALSAWSRPGLRPGTRVPAVRTRLPLAHPWGAAMPARLRRNTALAMISSLPCCSSVGCWSRLTQPIPMQHSG